MPPMSRATPLRRYEVVDVMVDNLLAGYSCNLYRLRQSRLSDSPSPLKKASKDTCFVYAYCTWRAFPGARGCIHKLLGKAFLGIEPHNLFKQRPSPPPTHQPPPPPQPLPEYQMAARPYPPRNARALPLPPHKPPGSHQKNHLSQWAAW